MKTLDEILNRTDYLKLTEQLKTRVEELAVKLRNKTSSDADMHIGSRLCLKTRELAVYCGKQFIDIWADFLLIKK